MPSIKGGAVRGMRLPVKQNEMIFFMAGTLTQCAADPALCASRTVQYALNRAQQLPEFLVWGLFQFLSRALTLESMAKCVMLRDVRRHLWGDGDDNSYEALEELFSFALVINIAGVACNLLMWVLIAVKSIFLSTFHSHSVQSTCLNDQSLLFRCAEYFFKGCKGRLHAAWVGVRSILLTAPI
jgi:hypothetical protein